MGGTVVPEHGLKSLDVVCITDGDRRDLRVPIWAGLNCNLLFICLEPTQEGRLGICEHPVY